MSRAEAGRFMSRFRRTGKGSMMEFNNALAVISGNKKLSFAKDWAFTLPLPARDIMRGAAALAEAEGMLLHASTLRARLRKLPKNSVYIVGRSRNGCSTGFVDTGRR